MVHLIFIALVLCLLLIFLVKVSALNDKARLSLGIMLIILAVGIGIFTTLQNKKEAYLNALAYGFLQGKDLYCVLNEDTMIIANDKNFNFISGTLTLMGKENGEYRRTTLTLKSCKLEPINETNP